MGKANKYKNCKHALKNMRNFVEVTETCPHKFEMGKYFVVLKNDCNECSFFEPKLPDLTKNVDTIDTTEPQKREYARDEMTKYLVAETAWHSFLKKVWGKIKEDQIITVKSKYYEMKGTVKRKYDSFLLVATKNYKVCINIGELFCGDIRMEGKK